ncbi:MAG: hypothetical protein J7L15_03590 [Clostridiales bacterium]|nr:hypothetical protein [Clostridiales bacterium]
MKLFEQSWTQAGKTYIREFDTITKVSEKRLTNYKSEYYLKDPLGEYKGFLDGEKLRKVQGSAYKVPDAYNATGASYVAIKEEFFGKSYNPKPGTFYVDIETSVATQPGSVGFPNPEEALEPIVLIQFFDTKSNKGYVLGLEEWYLRKEYEYDFNLEYIHCKTEKELLNKYLELFKELDPLIIYAWNGDNFDYPYIFNRMQNVGIKTDKLSNYGKAKLDTKKLENGSIVNTLTSQGHWYADLMEIYKEFVFDTVPSYSLDYIGTKETGISKVDHSNYLKFDDFRIGKYVILGNETEETKKTKIYKAAKVKEQMQESDPSYAKLQKYIKEKSYSEFCHYGVLDFVILKGIDESRNFTSIMVDMAETMGCQLQDTLGTLKPWNAYISNVALEKNLILPPRKDNPKPSIIGGFVAVPRVGKHEWVLSSDINSMYPLLGMVAHNMSAETFIEVQDRPKEVQEMINEYFYNQDESRILELDNSVFEEMSKLLQKYNYCLGFNGAIFSRDEEGLIPKLIKNIYAERKGKKKEMFKYEKLALHETDPIKVAEYNHLEQLADTKQMTLKIMINSLYGALAQQYFSLFNESFAAAITMNGRFFIRFMSQKIEEKLQSMMPRDEPYDIYNDTDSDYFTIAPFVEKYCKDKSLEDKIEFCDKFYAKIIDPVVEESIVEFSKMTNALYPEFIGAEREIIADSALFVAKKKYTARVRDNEGVRYDIDNPYIKVTGLEIQQGGTAGFAKKHLKEAIPIILDKSDQEIKTWFQNVKSVYLESHIIDKAKTIGVSKLKDPNWGNILNGRMCSPPFGSKACLATNKYLKENNLTEQFPLISPGEKVKILYLTKPNPLNADAFAFTDPRLAEMFGKYLDYDLNFEKYFLSPLENMIKVLNIDVTKNYQELDEW